jgi:hypothetical protein
MPEHNPSISVVATEFYAASVIPFDPSSKLLSIREHNGNWSFLSNLPHIIILGICWYEGRHMLPVCCFLSHRILSITDGIGRRRSMPMARNLLCQGRRYRSGTSFKYQSLTVYAGSPNWIENPEKLAIRSIRIDSGGSSMLAATNTPDSLTELPAHQPHKRQRRAFLLFTSNRNKIHTKLQTTVE